MSTRTTIWLWDIIPETWNNTTKTGSSGLQIHLYHEMNTNRYTLDIGRHGWRDIIIPLWKRRK